MSENFNLELENLEIYKEIVGHMSESIWIGDENFETIYINNIFSSTTGYEIEEIIGKQYSKLLDLKDIQNLEKLNPENRKIKYESFLESKTGEKIPVLCSGKLTKKGGIVLIISDLRELQALKKVKNELEELNKTKDEFISIVGHELRTPLTSIRGYLSMLLEGDMGDININQKKAIDHSYNSSVRLIQLVNDVLSIGKIESGQMEYYFNDIKVDNIINSIYKDIYLEIENKGITFNLEFDEITNNTIINTDKDKLKQVLLNLLTNALKFTESGGKITLKSSIINNKVRFEVIDNGIGIPSDKLDLLFSKFSQVEGAMQRHNTSGLGLGLAICKNFLEKLSSKIEIKSELGKGSNFYFDLEIKK